MLPIIRLVPGGIVEWGLVAVMASLAVLCWWKRGQIGFLVAMYCAACAALGLTTHAAVGSTLLEVSTYALAVVGGAIVAWAVLVRRLPAIGVPRSTVIAIIAGCLAFGVVGARVLSLALRDSDWGGEVRQSGLTLFGAFAIDVAYLIVLFRVTRQPVGLLRTLDAGASAIALNVGIARLGCLMAGCCFGAPTSAPWPLGIASSDFDPASPAGSHYAHAPTRIWATQLFEATAVLGIALVVELAYRASARRRANGLVIALAAVLYGIVRAALEGLRADSPRDWFGRFTVWQVASVGLVALGIAIAVMAIASDSSPISNGHRSRDPA